MGYDFSVWSDEELFNSARIELGDGRNNFEELQEIADRLANVERVRDDNAVLAAHAFRALDLACKKHAELVSTIAPSALAPDAQDFRTKFLAQTERKEETTDGRGTAAG